MPTKEELKQRLEEANETTERLISEAASNVPSDDRLILSILVVVFGLSVMGIMAYLIQKGRSTDEVIRVFGTITVIVSACLLMVIGYTEQQVAPVIGLLGTIVGYLLGKTENKPNE